MNSSDKPRKNKVTINAINDLKADQCRKVMTNYDSYMSSLRSNVGEQWHADHLKNPIFAPSNRRED
ncbi:MAG: hypothetical protein JJU46_10025 [Balneolaceae bacterium]|nr:hypothetical protein [Balneolaceae bacterium]MCH8547698.1 hypothetical protein [Balneolaceae bacterium]